MWAPRSVGAIEPVGIRNASITNPRNTKAKAKAMITEITVSLIDVPWSRDVAGLGSGMGRNSKPREWAGLRRVGRFGAALARPRPRRARAGGGGARRAAGP